MIFTMTLVGWRYFPGPWDRQQSSVVFENNFGAQLNLSVAYPLLSIFFGFLTTVQNARFLTYFRIFKNVFYDLNSVNANKTVRK